MTYRERYKDCLSYIDSYWEKITFKPTRQEIHKNIITIPHRYITPNDKKFNFIFYWDTYFMFRGLMGTKREWIMKEMVDNFIYLFKTYGIIPNFNSPAAINRSQPPFLSSMILDTYQVSIKTSGITTRILEMLAAFLPKATVNKKWLRVAIEKAKEEYNAVWNDPDNLYYHKVAEFGLNRYGDRDIGYAHSSELESGWDFTSRFYNRCNEFLPVDLNCYLYKYETDFATTGKIFKKPEDVRFWNTVAKKRHLALQKYLWNEKKGFFFDYNFVDKTQSDFLSLAGFVPLWAGVATKEQAKRMQKALKHFETDFGLTITAKESIAPQLPLSRIPKQYRPALADVLKPKQWDFPHIWPPLEYLTVIGLLRYGFLNDARRIMEKSVGTHAALFRKYKTFFEKIDGTTGKTAADFHYKTQAGFGWTNAIFYRYIMILDSLNVHEQILVGKSAPYKLSFLH